MPTVGTLLFHVSLERTERSKHLSFDAPARRGRCFLSGKAWIPVTGWWETYQIGMLHEGWISPD